MENNELLDKFWDLKENSNEKLISSINFITKTYFESEDYTSKEQILTRLIKSTQSSIQLSRLHFNLCLSNIVQQATRNDHQIIRNLFLKIFEIPTNQKQDIRKLGLEEKEKEEGEVLTLTILLKHSQKIQDSGFVEFLVEKVLIWSENGQDEQFLHLIQEKEELFTQHAKLLLNLFKTKIVENNQNIKFHHIIKMNNEKTIRSVFGQEIFDILNEKIKDQDSDHLEYFKSNIFGVIDQILQANKQSMVKFPFYIKKILLNITQENKIHLFISQMFSEEGLMQISFHEKFSNPLVKQNFQMFILHVFDQFTGLLTKKKSLKKLIQFTSDIQVLKIKSIITNVSQKDNKVQNIVNKRVNELNIKLIDFLGSLKDTKTISYLMCQLVPLEVDFRNVNFAKIQSFSEEINEEVLMKTLEVYFSQITKTNITNHKLKYQNIIILTKFQIIEYIKIYRKKEDYSSADVLSSKYINLVFTLIKSDQINPNQKVDIQDQLVSFIVSQANIEKIARMKSKQQFDKHTAKQLRFDKMFSHICQTLEVEFDIYNKNLDYQQSRSVLIILKVYDMENEYHNVSKMLENKFKQFSKEQSLSFSKLLFPKVKIMRDLLENLMRAFMNHISPQWIEYFFKIIHENDSFATMKYNSIQSVVNGESEFLSDKENMFQVELCDIVQNDKVTRIEYMNQINVLRVSHIRNLLSIINACLNGYNQDVILLKTFQVQTMIIECNLIDTSIVSILTGMNQKIYEIMHKTDFAVKKANKIPAGYETVIEALVDNLINSNPSSNSLNENIQLYLVNFMNQIICLGEKSTIYTNLKDHYKRMIVENRNFNNWSAFKLLQTRLLQFDQEADLVTKLEIWSGISKNRKFQRNSLLMVINEQIRQLNHKNQPMTPTHPLQAHLLLIGEHLLECLATHDQQEKVNVNELKQLKTLFSTARSINAIKNIDIKWAHVTERINATVIDLKAKCKQISKQWNDKLLKQEFNQKMFHLHSNPENGAADDVKRKMSSETANTESIHLRKHSSERKMSTERKMSKEHKDNDNSINDDAPKKGKQEGLMKHPKKDKKKNDKVNVAKDETPKAKKSKKNFKRKMDNLNKKKNKK